LSEDIEFVEFKKHLDGTLISVNILLTNEDAIKLMDVWFNKLEACQAPLIDASKDGLLVHIPWITKKET